MFGLSFEHLLVIAVVLLLFGARKLPVLGLSLGQAMRNFKKSLGEPGEIAQSDKESKMTSTDTDEPSKKT